jgi:hypothetical protein
LKQLKSLKTHQSVPNKKKIAALEKSIELLRNLIHSFKGNIFIFNFYHLSSKHLLAYLLINFLQFYSILLIT